MSKKTIEQKPTITIADCIRELSMINSNVFELKQGAKNLIEVVESGNLDHAKKVIEIFRMKQVLENLEHKD